MSQFFLGEDTSSDPLPFADTATTTDATPTTITTLALTAAGTYSIEAKIAAYNTTDGTGAGYKIFTTAVSDGATAIKLGTEDKITNEQSGMTACDVSVTTSGANVLIQVTGIAGKTINWSCVGSYVFVGA